ncbi:MAG TPA: urate oxidase [Tepidisphaeraceae bacterium]|nr:urate oxidase [Tepidisphaeraceae bacterium]
MSILTHNAYGKSDVRLTKVVRNGPRHELFEITANVQIEGDFAAAYTAGDNRNCVATDTMKNFVYVKAKERPFAAVEAFAGILVDELIAAYPQVTRATVELTQAAWRRIEVDGKPHDHAFVDGGRQKRYARAVRTRAGGDRAQITGGVRDLLVLKTTASEWRDFHFDRHRTLKDTSDRIMATSIDADWAFNASAGDNFDDHHAAISAAILGAFATQHSLGVQQTIQHMGDAALAACAGIDSISFALPNKHRIPFNLEPFGLKFENDVFVATDEPYGMIHGTIARGEARR